MVQEMHLDPPRQRVDDDAIDQDAEDPRAVGQRQKRPRLGEIGQHGFDPSRRFFRLDLRTVGAGIPYAVDHMLFDG